MKMSYTEIVIDTINNIFQNRDPVPYLSERMEIIEMDTIKIKNLMYKINRTAREEEELGDLLSCFEKCEYLLPHERCAFRDPGRRLELTQSLIIFEQDCEFEFRGIYISDSMVIHMLCVCNIANLENHFLDVAKALIDHPMLEVHREYIDSEIENIGHNWKSIVKKNPSQYVSRGPDSLKYCQDMMNKLFGYYF